jgi:AcrR family transcriptional regulator
MSKRFEEYARGARKIIVAAEHLFGKYGLDGVSLRQIIVAAGQVNPSAVRLHFGSKRGLIQAVYEMRTPALEAARRAKLDSMRKRRLSIADLLAAQLEPLIDVLPKAKRLRYAKFVMRLLPLSDSEHPHFLTGDMCAPSYEIRTRMVKLYPNLAPDIVTTRSRMAVCVFLQGICDERRVRGLLSHAYKTEDIYWDEIFQIALSIFSNPYPPPARLGAHSQPGSKPANAARPKAKRRTARRRLASG